MAQRRTPIQVPQPGTQGAPIFSNTLIDRAKAAKVYDRLCNIVAAQRFRGLTDKTILETINKGFSFLGCKMNEKDFKKALIYDQGLSAAYMTGREECIGMSINCIHNTISTQDSNNVGVARLAMDFLEKIDDGAVIQKEQSQADIQITATKETLNNLLGALANIDEPAPPDESDLDFDKIQEAEQSDAASQSSAPITREDYE